jgi:hypothetical protein
MPDLRRDPWVPPPVPPRTCACGRAVGVVPPSAINVCVGCWLDWRACPCPRDGEEGDLPDER